MKNEEVIALMAERDKLRAKIIALSKNKETRNKYNLLILNARAYEEITNKLVNAGKRVSINTDILKVDYWREAYHKFNENNPNIVMPKDIKSKWEIYADDILVHVYSGIEHDFKIFYEGFSAGCPVKTFYKKVK